MVLAAAGAALSAAGMVHQKKKKRKEKKSSVQQHSSTHSSGLPPQWTGEWWLLPNWNQTTYKNCGFTPSPPPLSVPLSVCLSAPSAPPCFWLQSSPRFIPSHLFQRTKKKTEGTKIPILHKQIALVCERIRLSNWWLGIFQMTSLWTVRVSVAHGDWSFSLHECWLHK